VAAALHQAERSQAGGAGPPKIQAEISEQGLRLRAQKLAAALVMRTAAAFEHRRTCAVARQLKGEGRSSQPAADGNKGQLAHRLKLGASPRRSIGQMDRRLPCARASGHAGAEQIVNV